MDNLKICKNCIQPNTRPGIYFDENGICGACLWEKEKQTIDWASRENTKKSFELIARYVMPHFHGSTKGLVTSAQWTKQNRNSLADGQTKAVEKAQEDYDSSATPSCSR